MKILVFGDVHANIDVLENLSNTDDYKNSDYRIMLGDIIGLGPDCKECIDKLKTMDTINIMGNHDYWISNHIGKKELSHCKLEKILHEQYFRNTLTQEDRDYIKTFKKDFTLKIHGKTLYFTHFIWESEEDTIHLSDDKDSTIIDLFKDYKYDYIFYAHEHDARVTKDKDKTLITFGCTGIIHPGYYGIIEITEDNITITQKTIDYNLENIVSRIQEKKYPFYWKFVNFYTYEPFIIDINKDLDKLNKESKDN